MPCPLAAAPPVGDELARRRGKRLEEEQPAAREPNHANPNGFRWAVVLAACAYRHVTLL